MKPERPVIIIGAGFTGLTCAYHLSLRKAPVLVIEKDLQVGGLASSFEVGGVPLERFYHHWFTSDVHVMQLIEQLGLCDHVLLRPTRTGMYFANNFFRLSTPTDLLRFKALPILDRFRLGILALRARRVTDWKKLEALSAREWLVALGGQRVYDVVWRPLLEGKFGPYSEAVSAVWFWNKLKLRGSSRGSKGEETLAYFKGGFAALADRLAQAIRRNGGEIRLGVTVDRIEERNGAVCSVRSGDDSIPAERVLATVHLPQFERMLPECVGQEYRRELLSIDYLGNLCLVLILNRSLSDLYWINVNEPDFPYVGVIEHTNFEPPESYHGKHVVYLSKYLPTSDPLYRMEAEEVFRFSVRHIQRMFPSFSESWVLEYRVWKEPYSQPVVGKRYSEKVPTFDTPVRNLHLATMAQIYPEDRGTNYAIREGAKAAERILSKL